MRRLFSSHKRFVGLGAMSALVIALAVVGTLWGFSQGASANTDGVTLVHVNPDGTVYTGNPYCPDTTWVDGKPTVNAAHDCNNITSQNHIIRTEGWDPSMSGPDWVLDGVGQVIVAGTCGSLAEVTGRALWDDDDGDGLVDEDPDECANAVNDDPADDALINDGCPTVGATAEAICNDANDDDGDGAVNDGCPIVGLTAEPLDNDGDTVLSEDPPGSANDDEQCVIIHSTTPGEVRVTLAYDGTASGAESGTQCDNNVDDDGDGAVNDGCPGQFPEAAATECADALDDDFDGFFNDGCPAVGAPEEGAECTEMAGPADDDDDGAINDGCPAQTPEAAAECDDAVDDDEDGYVNDGCPAVGAIVTAHVTDPVVKEWDSLVDSVILKYGDLDKVTKVSYVDPVTGVLSTKTMYLPKDVNGDGVRDADDEHELDKQSTWQDHGVVFDEALKKIRSLEPIQIIEVVHGEHEVLVNNHYITTHQPTEGALILAEIESERNCTFFTDATGTADYGNSLSGVSDKLGRMTVYVDTVCEEQAVINFYVQYPNLPGSLRLGLYEWIGINWTTIELAKQPQIRWAGEEIVLEKRWALPDGPYFPNEICGPDEDEACPSCPYAGYLVKYMKLDGPGGLVQGLPDIFFPTASEPDVVWTAIDPECISRALYSSEEQGQVDVEAVVQGDLGPENKHGFLVWYLKVYLVKLTNVDGIRADHNAGDWSFGEGEDTVEDSLNVSQDALLRVTVKGWFEGGNNSGRGAICVDIDGDGNGLEGEDATEPGEPYPLLYYEDGCDDQDDEILDHGHWVLPDDLPALAGPDAITTRPNWDVMSELSASSTGAIGPKSTLDSHDPDDQPVSWLDRTTVVPDGAITEADAIMPPLKIRASIADDDAGFLKQALKDVVYGSTNDYHSIMIPAHPDIPAWVNNGGYDWASYDLPPCPDVDADGVCDVDDLCPTVFDPTNADTDSDDLGDVCDADIDGDGILNDGDASGDPTDNYCDDATASCDDNCVYKANATQADADNDGVGDACEDAATSGRDCDGDAILDTVDNCPAKSNADQKDSDGDGYGDACDANPALPFWMAPPVPYPFWTIINKFGAPNPYYIEFYTDNRGEGMFFANGDYNLTFVDCRTDPVTGTPVCDQGDVVGESNITVIGDYPYFRKHSAVQSNDVVKTWEWGGFKSVSHERIDATHIKVIATLLDRDGYCKYDVDVKTDGTIEVVTSPSEYPVQGEEIEFILNTEVGSIIDISPNGLYNPPAPHDPLTEAVVTDFADGVMINRSEAVALAEDARVLEADEDADAVCTAWVVIEHPLGEDPDVSIIFHDPEGNVVLHWPVTELIVGLVQGWNDVCYVDDDAAVEDAIADIADDVLAVYLYDATDTEDAWKAFFPDNADLSDLDVLLPYDQLFILMAASADWAQAIQALPDSVDLVGASADDGTAGAWNSVCYAGADKATEEATSDIESAFVIMYTLGSDQAWRRYVPGRPEIPDTLTTLHMFDSVILLVTAEGPITWVFDP